MTQGQRSASAAPANQETTTVEIHNRTPFPLQIFRQDQDGKSYCANLLAGYERYVQAAVPGEKLSAKLECNGWTVKTFTARKQAKVVAIGEDVLRSRPNQKKKVAVTLDVPVRRCVLVQVARNGKERKLRQSIDHQRPAPTLTLPVGSVIKGMDPKRRTTFFWLIVTPAGQPNLLGQTFSTGTGWGVAPDEGEVALFLDLALGRAAGYQPTRAPKRPFYVLCHGDVPDLAALLDSRLLDFPDQLRTAKRSFQLGSSAATPSSIYDQVERFVPRKGQKRQSGGAILLGARLGPNTRAVFYEGAGFDGESFEVEGGALPKDRVLCSLNLEATRTAAQAGIRVLTSLSEDYVLDQNNRLKEVSRFRVALSFDSPKVDTVQVSSWEDDVEIVVGEQTLVIGPDQPATLQPNEFHRLLIAIEATEAGAPELLIRTNTMPPGTSVVVYPDEEMHDKLAGMPDGALHGSGIVDAKYSADECAQVQQALQNISRSMVQGHAETPLGVNSRRRYDPNQMSDQSWVLRLDPASGRPDYVPVSAATADRVNAETGSQVRDLDQDLAQGLGKMYRKAKRKAKKKVSKASKVVVKTTSKEVNKATKAVSKEANKATKTVSKEANKATKTVSKGANKAGDAIVDVSKDIGRGMEITIHYLDKTAVRFVVKTARQAIAAIEALIDMIEIAFDKFIEWVRFLFDWKDIKRAQEVYAEAIDYKLKRGKEEIGEVQDQLDDFFGDLRKKIRKAKGKERAASESKEATSPTKNSAKEKGEWFLDLLLKKPKKEKNANAGAKKDDDLGAAMSTALDEMSSIVNELGDFFDALFSGDTKAMADAAKEIALDFALLGCNAMQALADALLTAAKKTLGVIRKALNLTLDIPVLKQLYRKVIGGKFTPLNVIAFLLGLVSTVFAKVFAGKAPFGPKDSLVQKSGLDIAMTSTLAALDLVYGFLGAKSTLEAGADPLSPKTYDPLWKIMVVLKTGGFIEAIVQPFVLKTDAADLIVGLSSALKTFGQLTLQIVPDNTRRAEALLEAFFGGALKFVAGGLEIGTHTGNGVVLFLEGTGALAQIGGVVSNPEVFTPAAGLSMLAYTWAMSARLIQLSA